MSPWLLTRMSFLGVACLVILPEFDSHDVRAADRLGAQLELPKHIASVSSMIFALDDKTLVLGGCSLPETIFRPP